MMTELKKRIAVLQVMLEILLVLENCIYKMEIGTENKFWILLLLKNALHLVFQIVQNMVTDGGCITINGKKLYYMRGHLGQFVIVIPEDNLIIVRLGHIKGIQTASDPHSDDLYVYVEEAYKMLEKRKK